ncbi:hypothetical protein AGMMS49546_20740 [Spirochaetia bacterium]|nr:hypothetical protein AGMMS49546_20740 [Spirochaetia bacterium]
MVPPLDNPALVFLGLRPANPDDLRKSFFTKRKKDVIEFDFGDSGKTAYFAVQKVLTAQAVYIQTPLAFGNKFYRRDVKTAKEFLK